MDDELRWLEQVARAAPSDALMARRFGVALARAGQATRAALELARAVELEPSRANLEALDAVAPGGLDPDSPWPTRDGDARRSRRARVRGPERLSVLGTVSLPVIALEKCVIDATGALLAEQRDSSPTKLVRIERTGVSRAVEPLGEAATLLAGGTILVETPDGAFSWIDEQGRRGTIAEAFFHVVGLGHVVAVRGDEVVATLVAEGSPERWRTRVRGEVVAFALGPDATVVVHTSEGLGWIDLASGETRGFVRLAPGPRTGELLAGPDRTVVRRGEELFVFEGEQVASRSALRWAEFLVAIAGPREDVIVCQGEDATLAAYDTRSGREFWRTAPGFSWARAIACGAGKVYGVRDDGRGGFVLVAFSAENGHILDELALPCETGLACWSFALVALGERTIGVVAQANDGDTPLPWSWLHVVGESSGDA